MDINRVLSQKVQPCPLVVRQSSDVAPIVDPATITGHFTTCSFTFGRNARRGNSMMKSAMAVHNMPKKTQKQPQMQQKRAFAPELLV